MNIYKLVLESIEQYPRSEPIFIDEIKEYVIKQYKDTEREKVSKNINVILNRLKKAKSLYWLHPSWNNLISSFKILFNSYIVFKEVVIL